MDLDVCIATFGVILTAQLVSRSVSTLVLRSPNVIARHIVLVLHLTKAHPEASRDNPISEQSQTYHFNSFPRGVSIFVPQVKLQGLRDEEHDVYVVASCDFDCLAVLMRMQCSRALASVRSPCQTQVLTLSLSNYIAIVVASSLFYFV